MLFTTVSIYGNIVS